MGLSNHDGLSLKIGIGFSIGSIGFRSNVLA